MVFEAWHGMEFCRILLNMECDYITGIIYGYVSTLYGSLQKMDLKIKIFMLKFQLGYLNFMEEPFVQNKGVEIR